MSHTLKTQAEVIALLRERGYDPDGFIRKLRLVVPTTTAARIRAVGPQVAADALWHLVNDLTDGEVSQGKIHDHANAEGYSYGAGWNHRALAEIVADHINGQLDAAT